MIRMKDTPFGKCYSMLLFDLTLSKSARTQAHSSQYVCCSVGIPITGVVLRSDSIQSCLHW